MNYAKAAFSVFCSFGWLFNGYFLFDAWQKQTPVEPFISWVLIALCAAAFIQMLAEGLSHALR